MTWPLEHEVGGVAMYRHYTPYKLPVPGEPCPACERRVPLPKTEKTPPTKHKGYWVPADEHKAHEEVLETAAKFLGCYEQAFYEFKTVTLALALVLQDESLKGIAQRRAA